MNEADMNTNPIQFRNIGRRVEALLVDDPLGAGAPFVTDLLLLAQLRLLEQIRDQTRPVPKMKSGVRVEDRPSQTEIAALLDHLRGVQRQYDFWETARVELACRCLIELLERRGLDL